MSRLGLWWNATRPFAFPTSVIPAILGGLVAVIQDGARLNGLHLILAAVGSAGFHASSNLLNDYFDFRKGVDREDTQGASRGMLVSGRMTPGEILVEALVLSAVAAAIAVYFFIVVGPAVLPVVALGLLLGVGYTGAPVAFKYRALGDVTVFLAFGVGITVGSYVVQAGQLSWTPVYYGVPVGLLIWAILHANNLRDLDTDREAAITTLALLLGRRGSQAVYIALLALAYLSLVALVAAKLIVPTALVALLSLPLAVGAIRQMRAGIAQSGNAMQGGLVTLDMRTAQLQMAFGLLLILGLLGQSVL